jgi:hypothetical protein
MHQVIILKIHENLNDSLTRSLSSRRVYFTFQTTVKLSQNLNAKFEFYFQFNQSKKNLI